MNELWMWEYNDKTYVGKRTTQAGRFISLLGVPFEGEVNNLAGFHESHVTDLRPAKVVDAGAVVIEELSLITVQKQDICASHDRNTCICPQLNAVEKRVLNQLTPPSPKVEEPTGFEQSDYIINVPSEITSKGFQITIVSKKESE